MSEQAGQRRIDWPEGVLCVRAGPGANCSSIGSAVHLLFASAALAGVAAVVAAALVPARRKRRDEEGRDSAESEPREAQKQRAP